MSELCHQLHTFLQERHRYSFPFDPKAIPQNGIYILYEKGETGHGGDRIVRVGTHTGANQLRSRLKQHFLNPNKDRSIFRKNIGRCFLHKENDPYKDIWEFDLTTRAQKDKHQHLVDRQYQQQIEEKISTYIQQNFSFAILPVETKEERLNLESKMISTVSLCHDCRPSDNWLGLYSPKEKIRESGLWLVNQLYKEPLSHAELEWIKHHV
ncbi:MAG: hypothetical protein LRY73_07595 [Bacillus sp. (in: Bacteria)]|nr:hypothetical protein [Bacillus sp. (in: firmicutes)]